MDLQRIDHVVFTVPDIEVTCSFYHDVLGMEVITADDGRKALRFGECKINLHEVGSEFEPRAQRPEPGTEDLCLITTTPIQDVIDQVRGAGVDIDEPMPRMGALGRIESVYLRDPDGNLIEIARYISGG